MPGRRVQQAAQGDRRAVGHDGGCHQGQEQSQEREEQVVNKQSSEDFKL